MARAKDTVVIGYCHPVEVNVWFMESLLNLHVWDQSHGQRVIGRIARYSSANISNARNGIVRHFLASQGDWLLMLDTDMTFEPSLVDDLLANASLTKAPIVGALCFGVDDGVLFPTLYGARMGDDGKPHMVRFDDFPENTMMQVAGTGAACLLIHRRVLEQVGAAEEARGNTAYPWFQESAFGGHPMGEDVTFCLRAAQAGFPVHVDTGVPTGHAKSYVLSAELYRDQRARRAQTPPTSGLSHRGPGDTPPPDEATSSPQG